MDEMVYLNGSIIPHKEAKISILDYGFLFGYGLFETMRAYNGKVFCLSQHLERLMSSASIMGIPADRDLLANAIYDTIKANHFTEARVRLVVTPGEGTLTPAVKTCITPTIIIVAVPYHPYSQEIYDKGWRVIISKVRRNSQSPVPGMKSSNFLESMLVKQEAKKAGVDDALMLNDRGYLAEASSSNVFIVTDSSLQTPRFGEGLLPGITRRVVLEIVESLGIKSSEQNITTNELNNATEIFLTNSMIEIMPVVEITGNEVRNGKPGPVTTKLMRAYADRVKVETE
jgi:branched-chain amino acid aminotransferase